MGCRRGVVSNPGCSRAQQLVHPKPVGNNVPQQGRVRDRLWPNSKAGYCTRCGLRLAGVLPKTRKNPDSQTISEQKSITSAVQSLLAHTAELPSSFSIAESIKSVAKRSECGGIKALARIASLPSGRFFKLFTL